MSVSLKKLKSGTDVRGVASEGVAGEHINLTDDAVAAITNAFAVWLCRLENKQPADMKLAIGHDSRISADRIKTCVIDTLKSKGFSLLDCGLSSTPSMFMTTVDLCCDGAIQITASHHPFNRNGLKFFTRNGGIESAQLDEILALAEEGEQLPEKCGSVTKVNYMADYSRRLREMIIEGVGAKEREYPLKGYKIAVDAGNGAGGFYATNVLAPLGADIGGSRFLEPDGMFPNHIPNPENSAAMNAARTAVTESRSDLGIVFDTDVDRAAVVDGDGNEINRNRLIALAASIVLEDNAGATVVTDSVTSDGLTFFIENVLGGKHRCFKRGYKNVIDEAIRLNSVGTECPLAIETSGHAALKENYFLDDGAYLVTKIIIAMAKLGKRGVKIGDLLEKLPEPVETRETRVSILAENFKEVGEKILSEFYSFAEKQEGWSIVADNCEGVRVNVDKEHGNGWLLLRMSVHDPAMPINIESNKKGGTEIIMRRFEEFIKGFKEIGMQ